MKILDTFQRSFSKKANVKILDEWAVNETILANLINKFVVQIKTKDEKKLKV